MSSSYIERTPLAAHGIFVQVVHGRWRENPQPFILYRIGGEQSTKCQISCRQDRWEMSFFTVLQSSLVVSYFYSHRYSSRELRPLQQPQLQLYICPSYPILHYFSLWWWYGQGMPPMIVSMHALVVYPNPNSVSVDTTLPHHLLHAAAPHHIWSAVIDPGCYWSTHHKVQLTIELLYFSTNHNVHLATALYSIHSLTPADVLHYNKHHFNLSHTRFMNLHILQL